MAQLGRFSTPALRKRVCGCSVPCARVSQPCHPAATAAAEGLHLMLFARAKKGDIVPVLLPPNAAAERFQSPNYKCKCSESDPDGWLFPDAFLFVG